MARTVLTEIDLPGLALFGRGKVRNTYDLGDELLIVATDRISAFDSILPDGIPAKGAVLNQLSAYWFRELSHVAPNHLISADFADFPAGVQMHKELLEGRSMLVRKAERLDVECVVRGYLAGSAWSEYRRSGTACGYRLPEGLRQASKLAEPLFTPSTKEESGHDINITWDEFVAFMGDKALAEQLRQASLEMYGEAEKRARERGIIIADTKFEFGLIDDKLILIDEALTPDSSRFWPMELYQPGGSPPSFDKQFVRDWLESVNWNKEPPAPRLPAEVIEKTSEKYIQAYRQITGEGLDW